MKNIRKIKAELKNKTAEFPDFVMDDEEFDRSSWSDDDMREVFEEMYSVDIKSLEDKLDKLDNMSESSYDSDFSDRFHKVTKLVAELKHTLEGLFSGY